MLLQAHVVARLLGVRLLRVDADVVLTPAEVPERSAGSMSPIRATSAAAGPTEPRSAGSRLDEVVQVLDEARASLAAARGAAGT